MAQIALNGSFEQTVVPDIPRVNGERLTGKERHGSANL